jgi:hypothetical protein
MFDTAELQLEGTGYLKLLPIQSIQSNVERLLRYFKQLCHKNALLVGVIKDGTIKKLRDEETELSGVCVCVCVRVKVKKMAI